MIREEYVSFETAKMLKEAEFDILCDTLYDESSIFWKQDLLENINKYGDSYSAPTQAVAARWLREVHKLHVFCFQTNLPYTEPQTEEWEWGYIIQEINNPNTDLATEMNFPTYEQAMEAGIQKALELIKERGDNDEP